MADAEESKAVQEAVAAGMDPIIAKEMEEAGELTSSEETTTVTTPEEQPEHIEKKPEEEAAAAAGDEPAAPVTTPEGGAGDGGAGGEGGEEGKQPDRTPTHMPVWKAKELAKKAADDAAEAARAEAKEEYERKLAELGGKPGGASTEEVSKFAEEFGLQPEAAAAMIGRMGTILESTLGISELKKDAEARKTQDLAQAEIAGFETEFSGKDTQEALKAAAGDREITAEVKEKVKTLAYTTTYAKYRLPDIIRLEASNLFEAAPAPKPAAEGGRGGTGRGAPAKTIEQMTPEEINSLSDDEFLKLSDDLGKSGSRLPLSKGKR
jgi:hypothetical protein